MNTYEILISCHTTIVVQAENDEAAFELADHHGLLDEPKGWEIDETVIQDVLTTPDKIASSIRHSAHHSSAKKLTPYQ